MSNSRQYSLNDCHFPADLALGFVRIANAHQLPLSEALMRADPDEAVMRLDWKDSKSGEWAMVVISMFRFPGGEKEFERVCKWFGERKQRIRLPEGIAFAPEHNAFPNIPPSWSHEAWAESKYEVRHTYRRDNSAMFVRWSGTRAAMITHPLFVMVRENVQVVDGQWETTLPETTRNEGSEPEFIARSIDDALRREITVSAGRARELLELTESATGDEVPQAIRRFILDDKRPVDRKVLAIELGALWGESICAAAGWEWRSLGRSNDTVATVVCSPGDHHFVDPITALHVALQSRTSGGADHQMLLFNMIRAGNLPASAPGSLSQLK